MPEGQQLRPEGRKALPEGPHEVQMPEGREETAAVGAQRAAHTAHVPHQSSTGEAGAAPQLRRERRALYQPSATAVTSSPREAAELLGDAPLSSNSPSKKLRGSSWDGDFK